MKQFFKYILTFAAAALLCTACSEDTGTNEPVTEPMPEGYGAIRLNVTTAETTATRGTTGAWLEGTADERAIRSYHILICEGRTILGVISGDALSTTTRDNNNNRYTSDFTTSEKVIPGGTYDFTFYALANFTEAMIGQAGLTLSGGKIIDTTLPENFETKAIQTANTATVPTTGIPMTGKLTKDGVTILPGRITDINDDPIVLWRMLAKLKFNFSNESSLPVRILGVEVEPINQASEGKGVFLLSKDDLRLTVNNNASTGTDRVPDKTDVGPYRYELESALELDGKPTEGVAPTGTFSIYVNETDASATTTQNEYSLRFKIKRAKTKNPGDDDWYEEEIRYGFTQPLAIDGTGFNVIRRNDWITIPVAIADWRLRIEVLAFVPIGGYPAATLSYLDELNAEFRTGGWIVVKPIVERFTESGVESYGLTSNTIKTTDDQTITSANMANWMTYTPEDIFSTQPFVQTDGTIVAELSNDADKKGKATFTLELKLNGYIYKFKFNVSNN